MISISIGQISQQKNIFANSIYSAWIYNELTLISRLAIARRSTNTHQRNLRKFLPPIRSGILQDCILMQQQIGIPLHCRLLSLLVCGSLARRGGEVDTFDGVLHAAGFGIWWIEKFVDRAAGAASEKATDSPWFACFADCLALWR